MLGFRKRTEQKLQSFDWEKDQKPAEGKISPKILQEKNKERKHRKIKEKKRRRKKKAMIALLVSMLTSLEIGFEGRALFWR